MELFPEGEIKFQKLYKIAQNVTTFAANADCTFKALKTLSRHLDFIILYALSMTDQALP